MPEPSPETLRAIAGVLLLLIGGLVTWLVIAGRRVRGLRVVPYEGRRPQPWGIAHVATVFVVYLVLANVLGMLGFWLLHSQGVPSGAADEPGVVALPPEEQDAHPMLLVLMRRRDASSLVAAILCAGIIAPVAEEFLFRMLFQGYLESLEMRYRRRVRFWRMLPVGMLPIGLVSLLFAAGHYREPDPHADATLLLMLLSMNAVASVFTVLFAVFFLLGTSDATFRDLGYDPACFADDVHLGFFAFLAVAPLVFGVNWALRYVLPKGVIGDPIPLLLLSFALGFLFFRTHRLVPGIVAHMSLNLFSVLLVWVAYG